MYCTSCGAANDDTDSYCRKCGYELKTESVRGKENIKRSDIDADHKSNNRNNNNKAKYMFWLICFVVLLINVLSVPNNDIGEGIGYSILFIPVSIAIGRILLFVIFGIAQIGVSFKNPGEKMAKNFGINIWSLLSISLIIGSILFKLGSK